MSDRRRERTRRESRLEGLVRSRWDDPSGISALSAAIGVSRATLYSWFRGATQPNAVAISGLAEALRVSAADVLGAIDIDQRAASRPAAGLVESMASMASEASSRRSVDVLTFDAVDFDSLLGTDMRRSDWSAGFPAEVVTCDVDDPIGPVLQTLFGERFSQVPVRDGVRLVGLLTGETIARWLASRSGLELDFDARTPVREVLSYTEMPDAFAIVSAAATATSIVGRFDRALKRGRPLVAVLVTDTGMPDGERIGIVTPADLPALRAGGRERGL